MVVLVRCLKVIADPLSTEDGDQKPVKRITVLLFEHRISSWGDELKC